jgi:WD40 repeat protein
VATVPAKRHPSARDLARALEEVTLRVAGAEDKRPYPGLASFTEADVEYFFGREAEVEAVWKKLQRAHLLVIIGASGAGKTSFLQAGLVPAMPEGWRRLICHPGAAPFTALGQAIALEVAGDAEAVRDLLRFDEPDVAVSTFQRWRSRHSDVLLIIDQFEELFTLNLPEAQARFAELIGRLSREADVHVLLAMRDDFFLRCQEHDGLSPIFANVTPLVPPVGAALRRALVQPALACGYRLEEALVDDMLGPVREERGALPLLAFAAASLWEHRDRASGLLTRAAYERIGGVEGALARHAESVLERIGLAHELVVREVFRNLVTAQGTRAARGLEELLSVFEDRVAAREVIGHLIDARLLTSFEVPGVDGDEERQDQRVEIIHESLLTEWPRLVRWQTQDADSAQLRDQLHQAAQLWHERGRPEDLVWTGASFHELQAWRERYAGGLTEGEEAFARAMVDRSERQRRRKQRVVVAGFVVLVGVLSVVGGLWRDSVTEARRAEASNLLALGRLVPESQNSTRLAYAIASLERRDEPEVRRFALGALWHGPTALALPFTRPRWSSDFSPDGSSLLVSNLFDGDDVEIWTPRASEPVTLRDSLMNDGVGYIMFGPRSDVLIGNWAEHDSKIRLWDAESGDPVHELEFEDYTLADLNVNRRYMVTRTRTEGPATLLRLWDLGEETPKLLGRRRVKPIEDGWRSLVLATVDPQASVLAYAQGKPLELVPVDHMETAPAVIVGRHSDVIKGITFHPDGERIVAIDASGELRFWSITPTPDAPLQVLNKGPWWSRAPLAFDPSGTLLGFEGFRSMQVWDLTSPPSQIPIEVQLQETQLTAVAFHPDGEWIATTNIGGAALWPYSRRYPRVWRAHDRAVRDLAFAPDGSWLATCSGHETKLWNLLERTDEPGRVVSNLGAVGVAVGPQGRHLLLRNQTEAWLVSLEDGSVTELARPSGGDFMGWGLAFGPRGRFAAVEWKELNQKKNSLLCLYDLENGATQILDSGHARAIRPLEFMPNGELLSATGCELRIWDPEDGSSRVFEEVQGGTFDLSADGSALLSGCRGRTFFNDLQTGTTLEISTHGENQIIAIALDATGTIMVTGDMTGAVRVGPVTGTEPHLLLGHEGRINAVAIDPTGRWVVSGGQDGTVRLWSMPQGQPFHTLPYDELLERLRALANIRVVRDPDTPAGYRVTNGPFPGWDQPPSW